MEQDNKRNRSMNIKNLINGINFRNISDIIIDIDTINNSRNYFDKAIIFCKTDLLFLLFQEISSHTNSYTLITNLSDYGITKKIFDHKPNCIKKWFAQNVEFKHEDLIPIPIGLENHEGVSKGIYTNWEYWTKYDFAESYVKEESLYNNFSSSTHNSRLIWIDSLNKNGLTINNKVDYNKYTYNLRKHHFMTSPRGNGLDCHRTWEALYHECIPIVPKHFIYDTFDLPIIQVNSPNEITKEFIDKLLERKRSGEFYINKSILTLKYWEEKIRKQKIL